MMTQSLEGEEISRVVFCWNHVQEGVVPSSSVLRYELHSVVPLLSVDALNLTTPS